MKKELYEKIEQLKILTEGELTELQNDVEDASWVADMYGDLKQPPKEKNINRVVAGLKAHSSPLIGGTPGNSEINLKYLQALEQQVQMVARQLKQLHNQYNKLTRSQNFIIDEINTIKNKK